MDLATANGADFTPWSARRSKLAPPTGRAFEAVLLDVTPGPPGAGRHQFALLFAGGPARRRARGSTRCTTLAWGPSRSSSSRSDRTTVASATRPSSAEPDGPTAAPAPRPGKRCPYGTDVPESVLPVGPSVTSLTAIVTASSYTAPAESVVRIRMA